MASSLSFSVHNSITRDPYRVENILTGISEQNKILYSCPDFVILPDMKWDLETVSSLYLVALVKDHSIRSLRDLHYRHLDILRGIRREASRVVTEKWGLPPGSLRMYIHYQPSYCAPFRGFLSQIFMSPHCRPLPCSHRQRKLRRRTTWHDGWPSPSSRRCHFYSKSLPSLLIFCLTNVLQLELDSPQGPSTFQKMTLTYGLGDQHGLYNSLRPSAGGIFHPL